MLLGVFLAAGRVRAGWRFLSFAVTSVAILFAVNVALAALPATAPLIQQSHTGRLTVAALLLLDGAGFAVVLGVTAVAGRLEGRSLSAFGLPLHWAFAKRFLQGAFGGLILATLTIGGIGLLGGVTFDAPASSAPRIVIDGAAFAVAFVLVGLFEELFFRGYALVALSNGIGFWPAALVLAALFGGLHLINSGESAFGALNVFLYALVASFTLRRTGNLWFAIGMHAAWDYAQTFLFGVPTAGGAPKASCCRRTFMDQTCSRAVRQARRVAWSRSPPWHSRSSCSLGAFRQPAHHLEPQRAFPPRRPTSPSEWGQGPIGLCHTAYSCSSPSKASIGGNSSKERTAPV